MTQQPGTEEHSPTSVFELATVIVTRARLLIGLSAVGFLGGVALAVVTVEFVAESLFVVNGATHANVGSLSRLAANFGVTAPVGGSGATPYLYAEIVGSREVAEQMVRWRASFADGDDVIEGTFIELFDIEEKTERKLVGVAMKQFDDRLSVEALPELNGVQVTFQSPWPEYSEAVVEEIIRLTDLYNSERRRSTARTERSFLEDRAVIVGEQLAEAERNLGEFHERNRSISSSARLGVERANLERRVAVHQQVFMFLAEALEQARVEEVRDTPVLTVVESSYLSSKRNASLLLLGLIGMMLGFWGGVAGIGATEFFRQEVARDRNAYDRLSGALREALTIRKRGA